MGRPRKPSATRHLEGNRSRTDIPPELPLHGTPELPASLDAVAAEHFTFLAAEFGGAGVLKRADGPALQKLADLWSKYWRASEAWENNPTDKEARMAVLGFAAAWDRSAARLGLQVIDRSKLLMPAQEKSDATEDRFFKVTG